MKKEVVLTKEEMDEAHQFIAGLKLMNYAERREAVYLRYEKTLDKKVLFLYTVSGTVLKIKSRSEIIKLIVEAVENEYSYEEFIDMYQLKVKSTQNAKRF